MTTQATEIIIVIITFAVIITWVVTFICIEARHKAKLSSIKVSFENKQMDEWYKQMEEAAEYGKKNNTTLKSLKEGGDDSTLSYEEFLFLFKGKLPETKYLSTFSEINESAHPKQTAFKIYANL